MIILNFAHPFTDDQLAQIEAVTGAAITAVHHIPAQFDNERPFLPQIKTLLDQVPLNGQGWQTAPLLINPPGLAPAAAVLLALVHGRMGYFPGIIRIRPVPDSTPIRFEVAEVLNLQAVRENGRSQR